MFVFDVFWCVVGGRFYYKFPKAKAVWNLIAKIWTAPQKLDTSSPIHKMQFFMSKYTLHFKYQAILHYLHIRSQQRTADHSGALQFEIEKAESCRIQNPAYTERLNRLLWVSKILGLVHGFQTVFICMCLYRFAF